MSGNVWMNNGKIYTDLSKNQQMKKKEVFTDTTKRTTVTFMGWMTNDLPTKRYASSAYDRY